MQKFYVVPSLIVSLGLMTACTSTDSTVPPIQQEPTTVTERAVPPPTFVDSNGRLIAMGDVHGDYDAAINALKLAGAIDDNLSWIGGDLTIVQTGDQPTEAMASALSWTSLSA